MHNEQTSRRKYQFIFSSIFFFEFSIRFFYLVSPKNNLDSNCSTFLLWLVSLLTYPEFLRAPLIYTI